MLILNEKVRDEIVQALQVQIVPAGAGATIMQVVTILSGLKSQEPHVEESPEQEKENE